MTIQQNELERVEGYVLIGGLDNHSNESFIRKF